MNQCQGKDDTSSPSSCNLSPSPSSSFARCSTDATHCYTGSTLGSALLSQGLCSSSCFSLSSPPPPLLPALASPSSLPTLFSLFFVSESSTCAPVIFAAPLSLCLLFLQLPVLLMLDALSCVFPRLAILRWLLVVVRCAAVQMAQNSGSIASRSRISDGMAMDQMNSSGNGEKERERERTTGFEKREREKARASQGKRVSK